MKRTLLYLAVACGGCLEAEDDVVQFAEDFEDGLGRWTVTGEATVVTTNHPGEHAAWLAPGASIARAIYITRAVDDAPSSYGDDFTDGNWIEYTSDCGGRPALALEAATDPPTTAVGVRLVLDGPPQPGFARTKLMFPALPGFIWPPEPTSVDPPDLQFTSLVVGALAPCHLDNLRVMVSGGTLGYYY